MNRPNPAMPATNYKTYGIVAPPSTHWRKATCDEVNCPNLIHGWKTKIDESDPELGKRQAWYIRNESKRKYKEERTGTFTTFYFEPGQQCFQPHRVRTGKPELYVVRDGDWRGNPRGTPTQQHATPENWVDDFANHQDKLQERLERG